MITEKEIIIPEKLDDITLSQWVKIMATTNEKDVDDELVVRTILNVMYDIRGRETVDITERDMVMLIDAYKKAVEQKPEFRQTFEFKGVEYGFIPNLDRMTAGELIDIDSYSGKVETYHRIMSILYRPIIKKIGDTYEIEKYKGSGDHFEHVPVGIALGAVAFFLTLGEELTKNIVHCLAADNPQLLSKGLQKSGVGINQLMHWQTVTYYDLMQSHNWKSTNS